MPDLHIRHRPRPSRLAVATLSLVLGSACSVVLPILGFPPEAMRETPPEGIDERARDERATAPPIDAPATLPNQLNGRWQLPSERRVLLVFYRGAW